MPAPTSIAATLGRSRSSTSGSPGSALPWWEIFIASTRGKLQREDRAALGVGGQPDVEVAGADDRGDAPRVRILGRRRAGRPRRRSEHAHHEPPDRQHLAGAGGYAADPAGVGLREQAAEVRVAGPVAVLEQQPRGEPRQHGVQAALMVARLVRGHDEIQAPHARGAQRALDARLRRPAVEQHGRPVAVLDQRGVTLPDVQEGHGQLPGARAEARVRVPPAEYRDDRDAAERGGQRRRAEPAGAAPEPGRRQAALRGPHRRREGERHRERDRERGRGAEAHRHRGVRDLRRSAGDGGQEPQQRGVERVQRGGERRRDLRDRARQHPEPHDRRHRRRGQQVGGQRGERDRPEVQGHQRRRAGGGGDRDRRRVRDRAGHPPREQLAQRGRHRQQRDHGRERELPPRLEHRERVQRERRRRRQPERVPARGRPPREGGDQARRAHHPRTLDRRPAAGQRHVRGHQQQRERQPRPQRQPDGGGRREHEDRQQHHVLARDGQQVREPGDLELVADRVREPLVLTEHHAAQQRGVLPAQAAREPALRAPADAVQHAGEAAAALAGPPHRAGIDRRAGAARALVGVVAPQRRDAALHPQDLPDARHAALQGLSAHPQHGALPRQRPGRQPNARHHRPAAAPPHRLEQHDRPRDR